MQEVLISWGSAHFPEGELRGGARFPGVQNILWHWLPSVRGTANSTYSELVQARSSESSSSLTSQSSFSLRCSFNFKSACIFGSFMLPTQISMHTLSYVTTAQSARAPYVVYIRNEDSKLGGMYVVYACTKKEPQKSQEHTSVKTPWEHMHAPRSPITIHIMGSTSCICPGSHRVCSRRIQTHKSEYAHVTCDIYVCFCFFFYTYALHVIQQNKKREM